MVAMAHKLGLKVIAEGVETVGQYAFLKDTRCDEVQGYLISRPIPPDKVVEFIGRYGRESGGENWEPGQ